MKVSVETKFNIGDTVYIADHYYDFYAQQKPCIITDVLIKIDIYGTHIRYEVDGVDWIPEGWVFSTYEECKMWCKEHN